VQFILSLMMAASVGGVSGYLGSLMLSKRMALSAGPLGHLTLPGIALAFLYGFDVSLGAFPFVILGIIFIWLFHMRTKLPMEALTAIVFATGVAITFMFLPEEKTVSALIGDISQISPSATAITVILCFIIFLSTRNIFSKMILASISEDLAKVEGIDVRKDNLVYLGCIALTVAFGVRIVGALLTAALVAIPACASRNLSTNLNQFSYGAMALGSLASIVGVVVFWLTGMAPGPMIIMASTSFFLISMAFVR